MLILKRKLPSLFTNILLTLVITFSLSTPALANSSAATRRLAGNDRYETAVAIAEEGWTQSNYAILVCGDNYPDALVSTTIAQKYNAPILLSYKDSLPAITKQELTNLNVKEVILVGGTGVLGTELQTELLNMGMLSQRLAGKDRYETSLVVAKQLSDISEIAVATGEDFADALSIAPIAANQNMPILLVPREKLSEDVHVFISEHKNLKTYIIGNEDQISDSLAQQLPNVNRITGATKYERNIEALNQLGSQLTGNDIYVATGNDFADALTGTALAAKNNSSIVLVDKVLNDNTREYLDKKLTDGRLTILGGTGVVSESLFQSLIEPFFGSSFIQSWYCKDWNVTRWVNELSMLKDAGINEVIVQNIVDTTPAQKFAYYNTSLAGYTSNDVDLLDHALTAADSLGMKVRVGTADNEEWWRKGASDKEWLAHEASTNKVIIDEVAMKYATHPSFGGWYLSYEISNITAPTLTEQVNLNDFFKSIVTEMKLKTPNQTVMISPFYNSKLAVQSSLDNWAAAMENIFKGTGVDILALQDSVGVGYNTVSQLPGIFASTKKGTDAAGLKLYANIETFTSRESGNITAPLERITSQIEAEKAYVTGYVAFSINHYQGKYCTDPAKAAGYYEYLSYFRAHHSTP